MADTEILKLVLSIWAVGGMVTSILLAVISGLAGDTDSNRIWRTTSAFGIAWPIILLVAVVAFLPWLGYLLGKRISK